MDTAPATHICNSHPAREAPIAAAAAAHAPAPAPAPARDGPLFTVMSCESAHCVSRPSSIPHTVIHTPYPTPEFLTTLAAAIVDGFPRNPTPTIAPTSVTPALHIYQEPHLQRAFAAIATWLRAARTNGSCLSLHRSIVISCRSVCLFEIVFATYPANALVCSITIQ